MPTIPTPRHTAQALPSDPAQGFDADWERLVIPLLHSPVRLHAFYVAHSLEGFDQAVGEVMTEACRHGAGYLSETALLTLENWVITQLADCAEAEHPW